MKRFSKIVLVLLCLWTGTALCETPEDAEKAYNAAAEKAKAEYDAKLKTARDKFIVVLKDAMSALTKKGNLDDAIILKNKIAALEAESAKSLPKPVKAEEKIPVFDAAGSYKPSKNDAHMTATLELTANGLGSFGIGDHALIKWTQSGENIIVTQVLNHPQPNQRPLMYVFKPDGANLVLVESGGKPREEKVTYVKSDDKK